MPKKSECRNGRISTGGATCKTSEDETSPKLTNLLAAVFPSRNVGEQWNTMCPKMVI